MSSSTFRFIRSEASTTDPFHFLIFQIYFADVEIFDFVLWKTMRNKRYFATYLIPVLFLLLQYRTAAV